MVHNKATKLHVIELIVAMKLKTRLLHSGSAYLIVGFASMEKKLPAPYLRDSIFFLKFNIRRCV